MSTPESNLQPEQLEALAEWAAGRRAAGDSWAAMEEQLAGIPDDVVADLPRLVAGWLDRQRLQAKREATHDRRAQGETSVAAQSIETLTTEAWAGVSPADPILIDRANALRVIEYLRAGMLRVRWRWRYLRWWKLRDGQTWQTVPGAGGATLPGGEAVQWLNQAVVIRDEHGAILAAFPECRAYHKLSGTFAKNKKKRLGDRLEIQRREADCRDLDLRELAARLAAIMSAALGASSGFRDNAELARVLGVSREAVRVRKLRITQAAGMRAVEGLSPARAAGGIASKRRAANG
jgi:hypothetical protein